MQLSTTGKLRNDEQIHQLHVTPSNTSLWVVKKFHAKNMFLRLEVATKLKVQKCCQKSCNYYLRSYTSISSFSVKKAILKLNFEKKICLQQHSDGKLRKDEKHCIGRFLSYQKYRFLGRKRFSYKKHVFTL